MSDNKGRIIFLEHYLLDHADENHPITTETLIKTLADHGYSANRNTVRDDIDVLQAESIEVVGVRVGNAKAYYIKNRLFKTTELKALIDSVSSSQFIPERNSNTLIKRLASMAPEHDRKDLTAMAFTADRIKTDSPVAFASLDSVYKAIQKYKKLSFQYVDYLPNKEEVLRHNRKKYVVSPYALIWDNGRYYVPSYDPEKEKIVSYRVDRMRNVMILDERADRTQPFNPAEYCKRVLKMFDGDSEEQDVILVAENRYMINLIDRFGDEIQTFQLDENRFRAIIKVIPSYTFFSWIFQFCGGIRIIGPADVKKSYEGMLQKVIEMQQ